MSKSKEKRIYPVWTIANEILKIAKKTELESLTPMQLMKIAYIAHGWSFALLNRGLFSDRIEAWKYGPVIPSLYYVTKQFGRKKIGFELVDANKPSEVDAEVYQFLQQIVAMYGECDGIYLSSLTHLPGTPWSQVYEAGVYNKEIPNDLIKQHYKVKLDEHEHKVA